GLARDPVSIGFLSILIGIGIGASQPLTIVAVADHVEQGKQGVALGLRLAANRTAQLVNPVIFGLVAEAAGFAATFLTAGLLISLVGAMVRQWGAVLDRRGHAAAVGAESGQREERSGARRSL
ncbi:MAG TPA: MFS transporter, partial [Limnochordales bacterium]